MTGVVAFALAPFVDLAAFYVAPAGWLAPVVFPVVAPAVNWLIPEGGPPSGVLLILIGNDDAFKQELAAARRAMFETAMNRLLPLAAHAVDTLAALMGESAPPSVRLGAARTVAELGIHRDDAETILRKLGEIEALQRKAEEP